MHFYRWTSIFDVPTFTVFDHGRRLTSDYMSDQLFSPDFQLYRVLIQAPCPLGRTKTSHRFNHKAIDKLLLIFTFKCGPSHERLSTNIKRSWNLTKHASRTLPYFNRFGTMPRVLGESFNSPTIKDVLSLW